MRWTSFRRSFLGFVFFAVASVAPASWGQDCSLVEGLLAAKQTQLSSADPMSKWVQKTQLVWHETIRLAEEIYSKYREGLWGTLDSAPSSRRVFKKGRSRSSGAR